MRSKSGKTLYSAHCVRGTVPRVEIRNAKNQLQTVGIVRENVPAGEFCETNYATIVDFGTDKELVLVWSKTKPNPIA